MEKLSDHLFEVDPITIEFSIGEKPSENYYQIPVDSFSPSQNDLLNFFVEQNYDFAHSGAEPEILKGSIFMGVSKHENLSDSKVGFKIKKREVKSNQKIAESIDKIKKLYRNLSFYESFVPDEN